jgi:hypothetical protein
LPGGQDVLKRRLAQSLLGLGYLELRFPQTPHRPCHLEVQLGLVQAIKAARQVKNQVVPGFFPNKFGSEKRPFSVFHRVYPGVPGQGHHARTHPEA